MSFTSGRAASTVCSGGGGEDAKGWSLGLVVGKIWVDFTPKNRGVLYHPKMDVFFGSKAY